MIKSSDVCAGIVLFNPDIERTKRVVHSIMSQVSELYLVDNGSDNVKQIHDLVSANSNVYIIENAENQGIARALNQICQKGYNNGFEWVITLDQDTICPEHLVEQLIPYTKTDEIGIVCPAVEYEGLNLKTNKEGKDTEYTYACMTSSSLTNLKAWKEVGGFKESYFIDFVDNEFCMKLGLNGYKILRVFSCAIKHQLGNSREISILGKKMKGTTHNLVRCYYMMRNNLLFIKEYSSHLNVFKEYVKMFYVAWGEILYSRNRLKTLKYLALGIKDGIKGKDGRYEA